MCFKLGNINWGGFALAVAEFFKQVKPKTHCHSVTVWIFCHVI